MKPNCFTFGTEERLPLRVEQDVDLSRLVRRNQDPSVAVVCGLIFKDIIAEEDSGFDGVEFSDESKDILLSQAKQQQGALSLSTESLMIGQEITAIYPN